MIKCRTMETAKIALRSFYTVSLTVEGAVSTLCPWHGPMHFGNVPRAPSRLGSGFMLSRLGDATPRPHQPQTVPQQHFNKRFIQPSCVPAHCSANTFRSVKKQISPYRDRGHRTNYAQKPTLTNSSAWKILYGICKSSLRLP